MLSVYNMLNLPLASMVTQKVKFTNRKIKVDN